MLKYTKDKATGEPDLTKSPTLRIKLPQWEGVWKFEIYDEDGAKLYPREFAEVKRIADQCVSLAEALDKDPNTLQAIDLFQSVAAMARLAQSTPEPEPVAEAGLMVKCPKCGEEFAVKPPAEKAE
jgi:hypothetical protein